MKINQNEYKLNNIKLATFSSNSDPSQISTSEPENYLSGDVKLYKMFTWSFYLEFLRYREYLSRCHFLHELRCFNYLSICQQMRKDAILLESCTVGIMISK